MATMEQLTWVSGSFAARVLAARLYAEGIDAQLRGALDSPYSFTVGDMARVDVYVPTDQADDARLVMLAIEVDSATELPEIPSHRHFVTWPFWVVLLAGIVAAASVLFYLEQ